MVVRLLDQHANVRDLEDIDLIRKRVDPEGYRMERLWLEEGWLKSMAYFRGKHYFYLEDGRIFDGSGQMPEHKAMYKINLTKTALLRAASKVLNVNADFAAVPNGTSIKARNRAETSERLFDHIRDVTHWQDRKSLIGTMWAGICGSSFYRVFFDPLAGEPDRYYFVDPVNKTPMPGDVLAPALRNQLDRDLMFEDLAKGEISIANDSGFAIFHDWSSKDEGVEGCSWMASRHFTDIEKVADVYGVDENDLRPEEGMMGLNNYEEAIAFMATSLSNPPNTWSTPEEKRSRRCMVVDMWERPSRKHKRGRRIVYAGGKIVHSGTNPHVGDLSRICHLPWVKQDWTPSPGSFWGSGIVEDLTTPNFYLNQSRNALLEFMRIFGRPATYIWSDSGLDPEKQTIEPGGVYVIRSTSKVPAHDAPPALPPEVAQLGNVLEADMQTLSSNADSEMQIPAQMRSGAAVGRVLEDRDITLNITSRELLRVTRDVGRCALRLCQMNYDETRTLRYVGDDGTWITQDFTGADLTNDIVILGNPGVLDTVSSRREEILDSLEAGLWDMQNPDDKDYVLGALHYNDSNYAIRSRMKAQKKQEREIRVMIENWQQYLQQPYPVLDWEDHQKESRTLVDFFHTPEFQQLTPEQQSILVVHWKLHQIEFAKQQAAMMAMTAQTRGAPGEKGKASQPKK